MFYVLNFIMYMCIYNMYLLMYDTLINKSIYVLKYIVFIYFMYIFIYNTLINKLLTYILTYFCYIVNGPLIFPLTYG